MSIIDRDRHERASIGMERAKGKLFVSAEVVAGVSEYNKSSTNSLAK